MKARLLRASWFVCLLTAAGLELTSGQYQTIGSSLPVLAIVGDDVILPCHIEPSLNVAKGTVEWTRPYLKPQYVHLLQEGVLIHTVLNPLYKRRTSLFHEELPLGNISLKLSRVQCSDEGKFRCFVPNLHSSSSIQLLVGNVSQPVITVIGSKDNGLSLTCDSGCWYPQPEVSWLDSEGNNLSAESSVTDQPSPHCYIDKSSVTVRGAGHVTCRVHLPHFNHTIEIRYEYDIPEPSNVGTIVGAGVGVPLMGGTPVGLLFGVKYFAPLRKMVPNCVRRRLPGLLKKWLFPEKATTTDSTDPSAPGEGNGGNPQASEATTDASNV